MSHTYRKVSYKTKSISKECSNHGDCEYCRSDRLYQSKKEQQRMQDMYLYYKQELSNKGVK